MSSQRHACPHCSLEVSPEDTFCGTCGAKMVLGSSSSVSLPIARPRRLALLLIVLLNAALLLGSATLVYALLKRQPAQPTVQLGAPRMIEPTQRLLVPPEWPNWWTTDEDRKKNARRKASRRSKRKRKRPLAQRPLDKPPSTKPPSTKPPLAKDRSAKKHTHARVVGKQPEVKRKAPTSKVDKPTADNRPTPGKAAAMPKSKAEPSEPVDTSTSAGMRAALNAESVRMVVRHHLPQVRLCYDRALKQQKDLGGIVDVRFVVGADGRVRTSVVQRNTSGHEGLGKCIAYTVKRWRFPKPIGGESEFIYPFVFSTN